MLKSKCKLILLFGLCFPALKRGISIMENNNNFLSTADVGKILDVSKPVVITWLRKGLIKYSLVGHLQKIRAGDLLKYLEGLGNSQTAMNNFKRDIENYLRQKEAKR